MAAGAAVPDSGGVRGQQSPQVLVPMRLRGELTVTAALRRRPSLTLLRDPPVATSLTSAQEFGSPYPAPPAC